MESLDKQQMNQLLDFPSLVDSLRSAFKADFTVPKRSHHDMANPAIGRETTLLLMPAWEDGELCGVKIVTVAPKNKDRPTIQGTYMLIDVKNGSPLLLMDAPTLTAKRTAAASALASTYLSRQDTHSMLMVGTGTLAPNLIKAHAAVRPINKVFIWGRTPEKAQALTEELSASTSLKVQAVTDLEEAVGKVDLISVATMSMTPLIKGSWLKKGQHLDLVGAYRPDMREADDDAIKTCDIFVDTYYGATHETGEIVIPIKEGTITKNDLNGDLFELCRQEAKGRQNDDQITLFKSTGHALEDLAAAKLVYSRMTQSI
jgi:alanine dehydrogenase